MSDGFSEETSGFTERTLGGSAIENAGKCLNPTIRSVSTTCHIRVTAATQVLVVEKLI